MNKEFIKFIKRISLLSVITASVMFLLTYIIPYAFITPTLPFLILFFFSGGIVVHYILLKISNKKSAKFIGQYMLVTVLKNLVYIVVLLLYVFLNHYDAVPFIVAFFILYLIYTIFEIISILPYNRTGEHNAL